MLLHHCLKHAYYKLYFEASFTLRVAQFVLGYPSTGLGLKFAKMSELFKLNSMFYAYLNE